MPEPIDLLAKPCSESDSALLQGKPVRTWRPMAFWTAALLLALGLAWFISVVVAPVWQVRSAVFALDNEHNLHHGTPDLTPYIDRLGGAEAALPKLRLYLRMPEFTAPGRVVAVLMLGGCGRRAVPELVRMLRDPEPFIRRFACRALACMGAEAEEAMPALIGMLRDGDPDAQWSVCYAIGAIGAGAQGAVPVLIPMLQGKDPGRAARTLGRIGPKAAEAVPEIIALLHSQDERVVYDAAYALIRIGDPRMLEPFLEYLGRKQDAQDKYLRHGMAGALGGFRDSRVVRPLLSVLGDSFRPDPVFFRDAGPGARESIEKLFVPTLAALAMNGHCDFNKDDIPSAEELRDPLVFELLLALLEKDRPDAALLLGASGDRRALEPLLAALRGKDQWMRSEIAYALGSLADPRAMEPLVACLTDKDINLRAAAAWALGEIGPPAAAAVPALEKALADQEETVRKSAAEALKKIRGDKER
jgi:HEAT repeat protein